MTMSRALSLRSAPAVWWGWCLLAVAGATIGALSSRSTGIAVIGAILVLMAGLAAIDLGVLVVLALPATLVMVRVGPLSISDFVLAGSMVVALVLVQREELTSLQPLIWAGIAYGATLVPTLVLNRYSANVIEWAHEVVLVLGSLIVGWVIGRRGHARTALTIYVVGCVGIAIATIITGIQMFAQGKGFGPVYLPFMHKNFIGDTLAFALVIAYTRPPWLGWSKRVTYWLMPALALGIAASGARQAMISAGVALLVVNLRGRWVEMRRSTLLWFAFIPVVVFVLNAVIEQLGSDNKFNSSSQRLQWFGDSFDIWHTSPLFGVGLRWWYTDRFHVSFQPPNAELEMLTSAGVVGAVGFLMLFMVAFWVLAKMDPRYGAVALGIVVARFVQGQLDLYWVAGHASTLWIITGLVFGLAYRDGIGTEGAATLTSVPIPARRRGPLERTAPWAR